MEETQNPSGAGRSRGRSRGRVHQTPASRLKQSMQSVMISGHPAGDGNVNNGHSVNIARVDGHRKYFFDSNAFFEILDKCDDCPIAIYSMNGQRRRGKSLTINYMKLYLEKDRISNWYETNVVKESQFDDNSGHYEVINENGFVWRAGDSDTTQGISVWSEPYKVRTSDGQEVAVLLMDCQGNASDASDNVDNVVIFSMSLLLSTVFIHNTIGDLNNVLLQQFLQFADYAYQVLENNYPKENSLPGLNDGNNGAKYNRNFQDLVVWVRDWQGTDVYPFGFYKHRVMPSTATKNFKTDKMALNSDPNIQSDEVRTVRTAIESMFENVFCYLSPFPGEYATETTFDGRIDFHTTYGQCLKNFVEEIFSPYDIKPKTIRDTLKQLFEYLTDVYTNVDKFPKFKSVTDATHELICREAVKNCWDFYMGKMNGVANMTTSVEPDVFKDAHLGFMSLSFNMFNKSANVSNFLLRMRFRNELSKQIETSYKTLAECNSEKWKRIHSDLLGAALRLTPIVSGFTYFRDSAENWKEGKRGKAVINFLTGSAMLTLDTCTLRTASAIGKVAFYGAREALRAGVAYANGTVSVSDIINFNNKKYAVKGMIKTLIKYITNNKSENQVYDDIRLRRMIAASALEDFGITDTNRQELLLDVFEKRFMEIKVKTNSEVGGNVEQRFNSDYLLHALIAILESEKLTETDVEFQNLMLV